MGVNVKLGVDMSGFKQGMSDANAQLKSFDALLKVAETDFKKTGNAEAAMTNKTTALTGKLEVQKKMVQQYEQQLKKMRDAGIDPASKSYQQLQAAMLNMQAAANETEISLNGLNMTEEDYAELQRKMNEGVGAGVPFEAIPELPEDVTTMLLDQIGVLKLPAEVYLTDSPGGSGTNEEQEKANGIWYVPYDGYLARLHQGERVVPAREVSNSRSFSSNLYIENNYMNRDMDADALANAIASRNRRMMSGYGS